MTIDCHHHLDEGLVSLPGMIASMDAFGIEKVALIANMCPPLGHTPITRYGAPVMRMAMASSSKLILRGVRAFYANMVRDDGSVDVGGRVIEIKVQPRNDDVLAALERHPGRFFGWVFVNPMGPVDPVQEIERCLGASGMIGVKAHPFWHNYPVARLKDAAALCLEKGVPMLIHLGTDQNGDYRFLPESFPGLKVIYAHAGIPYQPEIRDYIRQKDNVFVDLSSSSYVDLRLARAAVRTAGAQKCLYGTDGPYFHNDEDRFDFKPSLDMVKKLGLVDEDVERIMGRNFEEIIVR